MCFKPDYAKKCMTYKKNWANPTRPNFAFWLDGLDLIERPNLTPLVLTCYRSSNLDHADGSWWKCGTLHCTYYYYYYTFERPVEFR